MTARQCTLKEPAAIFFIPIPLFGHGHWTMVIDLIPRRKVLLAKSPLASPDWSFHEGKGGNAIGAY
jgi:hypothetical protein